MNTQNLIELRCDTCQRGLGIAEEAQVPALRKSVSSSHIGHRINELPFVSATGDGQNTAATLVAVRGGLIVYKSDIPS